MQCDWIKNNACVLLYITKSQCNKNTDIKILAAAIWSGIGLDLLYR